MTEQRTYPHGVPCWIDLEQPDPAAASAFYGGLFGWAFEDIASPGSAGSYLIARLDGQDVGAIGSGAGPSVWNTYLAVDDADATAAAVVAAGGSVVSQPADAGPEGRAAACLDPGGAAFRLWQAGRLPGAQLVNSPGAWNFSNLRTEDPTAALAFYAAVFGWVADHLGEGAEAMLRVPGYGDHLAGTVDPDIYRRQAFAPKGFADAIAALELTGADERPHWHVKFTVSDRDESAATAERLGGTVLSTSQTPWTREALIRDPQGAEFSASQFTPPS